MNYIYLYDVYVVDHRNVFVYIRCIQCRYIYITVSVSYCIDTHWIYLHRWSESTSIALQYGIYMCTTNKEGNMCQDGKSNSSWAMFKAIFVWDRTRYQFLRSKYNNHETDYDLILVMNDGSKSSIHKMPGDVSLLASVSPVSLHPPCS